MSLLLDALKKAEQAKRKAQQEQALTPAPELIQSTPGPAVESFPSLELAATVEEAPLEASVTPGLHAELAPSLTLVAEEPIQTLSNIEMVLPEAAPTAVVEKLSAELSVAEPVAEFAAAEEPEKPNPPVLTPAPEPVAIPPLKIEPAAKVAVNPSPQVAQRILDAGKKPQTQQRRRLGLIVLGVFLGLLLGGLYLFGPLLLGPSTVPMVIPPQASDAVASQASASAEASAMVAMTTPKQEVTPGSAQLSAKTKPIIRREPSKKSGNRIQSTSPSTQPLRQEGRNPSTVAGSPAGQGPVLENTTPLPGVAPLVAQGFAAYQRGDLELASKKYRQAVNEDDQNRDALLGLAATSRRLGDLDSARRAYKQLLYLNPRDVDAKAGLSATQGVNDPQSGIESIKPLSDREADSPAVQSELGAMYVRQGRWSEAQAAYFNAFSANPSNPDLAFNLAICLDHLNEPKLALDYYRKAKQLGARHFHRFDNQQLDKRVAELEGAR